LKPALYLHVPYCRLRCSYCNFYFEVGRADFRLIEAFRAEMGLRAGDLPTGPLPALYLGGGTPSWLPAERLDEILAMLGGRVGPDTEFSVECNPEDLDEGLLESLLRGGVNRISLGVQSLNDLELKRCARRHDAAGARRAMDILRDCGLSWSADLIIGLPQQTGSAFRASLEEVIARRPGHVSLYTLELDSPVPLVDVFARHPDWDPGEAMRAELYLWAQERLEAEGFIHYEVSNWSLPGRECRYNADIWRGGEYMGMGPSAHSHLGGRRLAWPSDVEAWMAPLLEGRLPKAEEDLRTASDRELERLLLGLRLREGLPRRDPSLSGKESFLAEIREMGWIRDDPSRLSLTASGWLRLDGILARLST